MSGTRRAEHHLGWSKAPQSRRAAPHDTTGLQKERVKGQSKTAEHGQDDGPDQRGNIGVGLHSPGGHEPAQVPGREQITPLAPKHKRRPELMGAMGGSKGINRHDNTGSRTRQGGGRAAAEPWTGRGRWVIVAANTPYARSMVHKNCGGVLSSRT